MMELPSPSIVNQHLRGTKVIGDKFARRYEDTLKMPANWLDTDHLPDAQPQTLGQKVLKAVGIPQWDYLTLPKMRFESADDEYVEFLTEHTERMLSVHKAWLEESGLGEKSAATMIAPNDDMGPRIVKGDTLIVRVSDFKITSGRIYVCHMQGQILIRRLFIRPDGGLKLVADNPDKQRHPDWELPAADAAVVQEFAEVVGVFGKL
jgi:hypothetical protein